MIYFMHEIKTSKISKSGYNICEDLEDVIRRRAPVPKIFGEQFGKYLS